MNGAFEVRLTEADLVHAFRLNARRAALRPLVLAAILAALLLALLLAISPAARHSLTSRPLTLMLEGALLLAVLLLLLLAAARPAVFHSLARRTLDQRRDLAQPITWTFDGEGLGHKTVHADSRYPWAALRGWREDDAILLVYVADNLFYILPKTQIETALLDDLRLHFRNAGLPIR